MATARQPAAGAIADGELALVSGSWPAAYVSIFINWLPALVRQGGSKKKRVELI